jgi:nitrogen regulatory protein P-II 1
MVKVEAVVIRERVETVIDAVEEAAGHIGVTVVEAVGHGRQRGITHEYRGRVFESRFLPKALLVFVVDDWRASAHSDYRTRAGTLSRTT